MTRKRISQVTPEEKNEIQTLFERKNGLNELARILTADNTELYERLVRDFELKQHIPLSFADDRHHADVAQFCASAPERARRAQPAVAQFDRAYVGQHTHRRVDRDDDVAAVIHREHFSVPV